MAIILHPQRNMGRGFLTLQHADHFAFIVTTYSLTLTRLPSYSTFKNTFDHIGQPG